MGMVGRPRVPTRLKILRGNPGRRPIDDADEPKPKVVIPDCPSLLKGAARKEWDRITTELASLEMISHLDRAALAAYCVNWARWNMAEQKLKSEELVFTTEAGYQLPTPWLAISHKAAALMHKFLIEFGFTPASRSRIKVEKAKEVDPFESYRQRKQRKA